MKKLKFKCNYCGEVYVEMESDYVRENSFASSLYKEQEYDRHLAFHCEDKEGKKQGEVEIHCLDCGIVLATTDIVYTRNNPNGFDMWKDELRERHNCNIKTSGQY